MSRGPGHVQRAILGAIAAPEAAQLYDHETARYPDQPGPVGTPLAAIYLAVYGPGVRTRAQHVSVDRAIWALTRQGLANTYMRRMCPRSALVAYQAPCEQAHRRASEHADRDRVRASGCPCVEISEGLLDLGHRQIGQYERVAGFSHFT
jgi:hypothetical protein